MVDEVRAKTNCTYLIRPPQSLGQGISILPASGEFCGKFELLSEIGVARRGFGPSSTVAQKVRRILERNLSLGARRKSEEFGEDIDQIFNHVFICAVVGDVQKPDVGEHISERFEKLGSSVSVVRQGEVKHWNFGEWPRHGVDSIVI